MNRKHLRSLAAVRRSKKNARSLEQDLVHFGVLPPGTPRQAPTRTHEDERADFQMHNTRHGVSVLGLDARNVDFADVCGDMLNLQHTDEYKETAAKLDVSLAEVRKGRRERPDWLYGTSEAIDFRPGAPTPEAAAEAIREFIGGVKKDHESFMKDRLVDGTPEQFFEALSWHASLTLNSVMEIGVVTIGGQTHAAFSEQRERSMREARDIMCFILKYDPNSPMQGRQLAQGDVDSWILLTHPPSVQQQYNARLSEEVIAGNKKSTGEEDGE